jgi:plasmid stabilization system protein ParE
MIRYRVQVSPTAALQIGTYGIYIAEQSGSAEIAQRWIDRVYMELDTLSDWPRRFELAEENAHRDYEIRRKLIGKYLALYTVDDESHVVRVIGFRHGSRLPRPDELP